MRNNKDSLSKYPKITRVMKSCDISFTTELHKREESRFYISVRASDVDYWGLTEHDKIHVKICSFIHEQVGEDEEN